jgi:hypothetical protein
MPVFTDVILVTLYVIGCMLAGGLSTCVFVVFFDPAILIYRVLSSLSARRKPTAPTHKARRRRNRANRRLLRQLIFYAAALPGISSCAQAFDAKITSSRAPIHMVASTSALKGMNLQLLCSKIFISQQLTSLPGTESLPLSMDCGAPASTSPSLDDFEPDTIRDLPEPIKMCGIGGDVEIRKAGVLRYSTVDDFGDPLVIRTPVFYMPNLNQRLFSPQVFFHTGGKQGELTIQANRSILRMVNEQSLTMPLDPTSRLFYAHVFSGDIQTYADALANTLNVTSDENTNLTRAQKGLLRAPHALAHCSFSTILHIAKLGWLGTPGLALSKLKEIPLCSSCQYGKGHMRNPGTKTEVPNPAKEGAINKDKLVSGAQVSLDHFVVRKPGRRFTSRGHESTERMFKGGTIFVDVASGRIKLKFQVSLAASDTIRSKKEYERDALNHGVQIQTYRSNNGTFTAQAFIEELNTREQSITFSGSGAQHDQNGVAERAIKTVSESARTMMLHCALRWPDAYDPLL